jgi:ferredoxin
MANKNDKLPTNVPGAFYIDTSCIDCDLCRQNAPRIFRRDDELGSSVAFHQPQNEEELREAREAMDGCPTSSIGNDG